MKPVSLVNVAHGLIEPRLRSGAFAIDATAGNGHDTLFLAERVGATGRVYSFDIQPAALASTRSRLQRTKAVDCVTLIRANHALMAEQIPACEHGRIGAIMFNLGYLPGGDKAIITAVKSTLPALSHALRLLAPEGIITIIAYPGHPGGRLETERVMQWCKHLNRHQFTVTVINSGEPKASAPILVSVVKNLVCAA